MKQGFRWLVCALAMAVPGAAVADVLVVLNKSDHEAALVNPETYEVMAKLPTGRGPHEAATSPDGRTTYVADYGSFAVFRQGEQQETRGSTITVLDLRERKVKATFELGGYSRPHGIWVSRDGSRLWVTCEAQQSVLEIDAASGDILKAWKTGQQVSHMLVPTADEKKLYVANIGSGSATVIIRATDEVKTIPTGAGTEGIDISPDGREVWVSNRGANTVSVINTSTDEVVASFDSGGQMPIRVKFTPDGKQVWVSNARSNSVSVFDASTRQLLGKVEVGVVPVGILMEPNGKRAFVANTNSNQLTVVDVASRKVVHTFTTGTEPDGMAWAQ